MTDKPETVEEFQARLREQQLWSDILRTARIDPVLRESLEPAIVYFKLKYGHR